MNEELWDQLNQISKLIEEHNNDLDKMAATCPPEMKLAVTKWVLEKVAEHGKEGGSYRNLIYTRLGFGPEAYGPLLDGGMFISNEFDVDQMDNVKKIVKEHKIDVLKEALYLCDEPGCYDPVTCGWPSDDGYRSTCGKHYVRKDER